MSLPYYESGNINGTIILLHDDAIVLELAVSYVPLLLKTSNDTSRRMRNFLLVYVMLMVAISTVYITTATITLTRSVFSDPNLFWSSSGGTYVFENGVVGAVCTTLASWGADGFMVSKFNQRYKI